MNTQGTGLEVSDLIIKLEKMKSQGLLWMSDYLDNIWKQIFELQKDVSVLKAELENIGKEK